MLFSKAGCPCRGTVLTTLSNPRRVTYSPFRKQCTSKLLSVFKESPASWRQKTAANWLARSVGGRKFVKQRTPMRIRIKPRALPSAFCLLPLLTAYCLTKSNNLVCELGSVQWPGDFKADLVHYVNRGGRFVFPLGITIKRAYRHPHTTSSVF